MALKVKELSEVYDMQVYTDQGDYFGDIEETVLTTNKVFGWRIRATKQSFLKKIGRASWGVRKRMSVVAATL